MHTNKLSQNFLLNDKYRGITDENLIRVAFRFAQSGKQVLYIAAKALESLPMDDEFDDAFYRDILKNIVFSYSPNSSNLINFLLDLRQYRPKPDVIIVDFLHTFFDDTSKMDTDDLLQKHFIECHMLITAAVQSAADMFSIGATSKFKFVDLYYYKKGAILTFDDITENLPK